KKEFIQHFENGEQKSTEERELERTEAEKRIVRVGSKTEGTHQYKEEIPFKYTVVYDPEMKAGTYEEVTHGKVGERVTIWNIKNSKVVGEPTTIETKPVDAVIKVGSKDFTGSFETKKTDFIEFETIYEVDSTMEPGTTKVVQEGQHGEIETTVTHTIVNGEVTESKDGAPVQTKSAINRIVKVGAAKSNGNHEYTNKIPFDVEVRVNPQLKKGEHKVVQKGEVGEEKYTLTIVDSKVTNTSEPTTTKAAVKEIIEVGIEDYTGTFETKKTSPVEFETEYVVDNSLEPGTTVVEQEGSLGEETTTVTHKIENGKVVESTEGETTQTKAPTKRIVKVGPAKTDGSYTYTNKKPFDVEVRVNPDLPKGEYKVIQEGVEGEEEVTVTIENSKVTETSEPKETKAPVNEIIEVGSEDFTGEVKHKEHFEIPFEVEVRYNDQLPAGTSKEIQKGEKGSYDV
ncbi:MAG: G5 domain-containing protein, partial [Finegoldia magna]|nr:G5 domain-containing protein [Finegoldia magna]